MTRTDHSTTEAPVISYDDSEPNHYRTAATRALFTRFVRRFYLDRDVAGAFEEFVAPDYIQHNPGIADGRDAAVEKLAPMFADPAFRPELKRLLVDGDYAVLHLHGRRAGERGGAVMDMYRVENGKIVEHWDVIQPIPESGANDHPLF